MRRRPNTGLVRSVQDRLRNVAERDHRPYAEVLLHYWLERFLFRLSRTPHRDRYLLKGALLMRVWEELPERATRDIDLLGPRDVNRQDVERMIRDCMSVDVADDGLDLDSLSLRVDQIHLEASYPGFRARFQGHIGSARLHFQVDIGVGDEVVPAAVVVVYPTLLNLPRPELKAYTPYTAISEKLQTIVHRGEANSRMRDYYDLYAFSRARSFAGRPLVDSLRATFRRRSTALPEGTPLGLREEFADLTDKRTQWSAFLRRARLGEGMPDLAAVLHELRVFLLPAISAALRDNEFDMEWSAGGPWQPVNDVSEGEGLQS